MQDPKNEISLSDKFINPEAILSKLGISRDSVVADFGCGSGYFSIPTAKIIREGKLYSLDVLPQALESVESQAKILGISNIVTQRVNLEKDGGSKLGDNSVDWVILKDMLFQNKNKSIVLKEACRILKPGGRALIVEWKNESSSIGPDKNLRINDSDLEALIQEQRLRIEKKIDAGDFHYGFVVVKS